jgi:lysyl-tRNA synthetase class 2
MFLLTSPEHGMKRLLAAGYGPVVQITRAFRDGERGRLHNPEFTIIEWYRPAWDHRLLMEEVEALVRGVLTEAAGPAPDGLAEEALLPFERVTYREAFRRTLDIDPFEASAADLRAAARTLGVAEPRGADGLDRDSLLNLLLATGVEPTLGRGRPSFLLDYPASQAALARVRPGPPDVAERFELYVRGVELANGYHELLDPREQARRFEDANAKRLAAGKEALPADTRFLAALEAGLPQCSGVALGLDRLVMLALGRPCIDDVWAFPIEIA